MYHSINVCAWTINIKISTLLASMWIRIHELTHINSRKTGWVDHLKTHRITQISLSYGELSWVRPTSFWRVFIIKNAIFSLFVSKSSIKSLKSIFNFTLIRTYVKIVRNNKKNKKWKSKVKMIAEKFCYQLILDKKTIEDILNFDFNSKLNNSSYHFIDSYKSRIAKCQIWFIQSIIILNDKEQTTTLCARNHYEWKKKRNSHLCSTVQKICWKSNSVRIKIN